MMNGANTTSYMRSLSVGSIEMNTHMVNKQFVFEGQYILLIMVILPRFLNSASSSACRPEDAWLMYPISSHTKKVNSKKKNHELHHRWGGVKAQFKNKPAKSACHPLSLPTLTTRRPILVSTTSTIKQYLHYTTPLTYYYSNSI